MTTTMGGPGVAQTRLALVAPSATEVVDTAVDRIAPVAGAVLVAAAVPVAPVCLLGAAIPLAGLAFTIAVAVLALPAVLTGVAGVVVILGDAGLGRSTSAAQALRRSRRFVIPLIRLTLRSLASLVLGLVVLGLGRLAFAAVVLVLEEATPKVARRRTSFLLRGAGGTAALVLLLGLGLAAAVAAGGYGLATVLVPAPSSGSAAVEALHVVLGSLGGAVLGTVALGATAFCLFVSRREQLEALDLQLALQRIGGPR